MDDIIYMFFLWISKILIAFLFNVDLFNMKVDYSARNNYNLFIKKVMSIVLDAGGGI